MISKTKILLGGLTLGAILLASLFYSIVGDLPDIRSLSVVFYLNMR